MGRWAGLPLWSLRDYPPTPPTRLRPFAPSAKRIRKRPIFTPSEWLVFELENRRSRRRLLHHRPLSAPSRVVVDRSRPVLIAALPSVEPSPSFPPSRRSGRALGDHEAYATYFGASAPSERVIRAVEKGLVEQHPQPCPQTWRAFPTAKSTKNRRTWPIFHTFGGEIHLYDGLAFL